jgi:predicted Rossmann fold flavoprotein
VEHTDIVVIGGGAAGMMAALAAREKGAEVTLIEPNEKLGRKLYITGKGRCNLTNDCNPEAVLQNIPNNSRFLYSAVNRFPPAAVKEYFETLGVPLKTERGGRVFPKSDKAADIIDALFFALRRRRVNIIKARAERLIVKEGAVSGVKTEKGIIGCRAAILATGGLSYPLTGSTGEGHLMAAELGHTVLPLKASLVPLVEDGTLCSRMQGLSLRNVTLTVKNMKKKVVFQEQGELLFTHYGLSGPLVLSASAHMQDFDSDHYVAIIDLKPALDEHKLEERILRDFSAQPNRNFQNILEGLLPRLMIPVILDLTGIPGETKVHLVSKQQRRQLVESLKRFRIEILEPRSIDEAIITAGGVKTGEINPGTMMSKKVSGLFFAGELIDVDAYTGGFNLQIAWCTGRVAGESAGDYCKRGNGNAISEHSH